jgi:hypothetical protein
MEPAAATGGNQWQMQAARDPRNQAETVAAACDRLPREPHGKEGSTVRVRQRASQKRRKSQLFSWSNLYELQCKSQVQILPPLLRKTLPLEKGHRGGSFGTDPLSLFAQSSGGC